MSLILTIFPAAVLAVMLHKEIEETYAASIILLSLLLLVLGKTGMLRRGWIVVPVLFLLCLCYLIFLWTRDRSEVRNLIQSRGFLLISACILLSACISYGRDLYASDDLRAWGLAVKDLYLNSDGGGIWGPYKLLTTYWEWLALKLSLSGYRDSTIIFAHNVFTLSFLLPISEEIRSKRLSVSLMAAFTVFLIPAFGAMGRYVYFSLMNDAAAGCMLFYGLYYFCHYVKESDRRNLILAFCTSAGLVVMKRAGILFAALLLTAELYILLHQGRKKETFRWCLLSLAEINLVYLINDGPGPDCLKMLLATILLQMLLLPAMYEFALLKDLLHRKITAGKMAVLLLLCAGELVLFCLIYLRTLEARNQVYWQFWSLVPFVKGGTLGLGHAMLMSIVIAVPIGSYLRQRGISDWKLEESMLEGWLLASIFYILIMLAMQIYLIAPANGNEILPEQDRYLNTFTIVYYFGWLIIYYRYLDRGLQTGLVVLVIVMLTTNTFDLWTKFRYGYHRPEFDGFERAGITLQPDDRIYYIDEQADFIYQDFSFAYAVYPIETNAYELNALLDETSTGRVELTTDELCARIYGYQYLYLNTIDKDFIVRYRTLFPEEIEIENDTVYRIEDVGGFTRCIKVP